MGSNLVLPRPCWLIAVHIALAVALTAVLADDQPAVRAQPPIDGREDVATYRDYRILLGIQRGGSCEDEMLEIGYVFGRRLRYRSGTPSFDPPGTILLRTVRRY